MAVNSHYRGRLKHGRHFTFKSAAGDVAITLVTPSVEGSFADNKHPYATHGPWLHVLVEEDFLETLITDLAELAQIDKVRRQFIVSINLCILYRWPFLRNMTGKQRIYLSQLLKIIIRRCHIF